MANFVPRLTAPSSNDPKWINRAFGGYNRCIAINDVTGSVLPNCPGYAWGRALEILHVFDTTLCTANAYEWYTYNDGFTRGSTARLGAIICYSGGVDNLGHVAVVEEINPDGTITISESNYGGAYFRTVSLPSDYSNPGLTFQGFIYLIDNPSPIVKKSHFPWVLYSRKLRSQF